MAICNDELNFGKQFVFLEIIKSIRVISVSRIRKIFGRNPVNTWSQSENLHFDYFGIEHSHPVTRQLDPDDRSRFIIPAK